MASQSPGLSTLLGMGVVIAAQLAIGVVLGLVIDSLVGSSPVFLFVGLLLGVVGAITYTVTKFRQYLKT